MIKLDHTKSAALLERSKKVLAGGVSSEFRKFNHPHALFYDYAEGVYTYDVDGNKYLDFTLSQGPMIVGHSHPHVLKRIQEYSGKGQLFAGQHILEVELAEKLNKYIPSAELMRFCLDGSTAVQTAFRVARAKTGRKKFIRFEGHYHGWLDNVSWGLTLDEEKMGNRESPIPLPWTSGIAEGIEQEFLILPWNDLELVKRAMAENHNEIAAIITEPIMCNSGCILPEEGFLKGLREICTQYNAALIFDEVITGFRTSLGGAQKYFNVTPDLSIFAKALASGFPISAIVGKKDWMQVVAEGKVIHAGTMNSACALIAAAIGTIEVLEQEGTHERIYALGHRLMKGLRKVAEETKHNLLVQGLGPMFHTGFASIDKVKEFRDVSAYEQPKSKMFIQGMQQRGVRIIGRGLWYISAVHEEKHIDFAIEMARETLLELE
ncbi:aspartate aminotransferase family protein [Aurantibacter crassamenti]|uniref:aspartate aminotransferase family protein n=1 Tax=Aurantibacter crassamenti TaxID=1837375 RepID=UPI00193A7088|nr:aspartate aminotransferase family protein [Aurantibacter crassamenti]MBM1105051.1 aspartate aminotransferase family protein [Aurantibacter crassamenti]